MHPAQVHGETGKTVLITGGSRGIGRAIALRLATGGECGQLFINYVQNQRAAEDTCKEIESQGVQSIPIRANLAYPDGVDQLFDEISEKSQRLDALIHCAAINVFKPLIETRANQWDLIMNINARGLLLCSQRAAAMMDGGHIVAISSWGGQRVVPNYGALGPTKAALEAVIRYLAVELASKDIRVNGVLGGLVATDSLEGFPESSSIQHEVLSRTPGGRLGLPGDIAGIVNFLISPDAQWICGQLIVADGGYSLTA